MRELFIAAYFASQRVPAFAAWREYEERQWLDSARYEASVAERLQRVLELASRNVPFYAESGMGSDISAYPPLRKRTIWDNYDRLQSRSAPRAGSFETATSGSTGRRLRVMVDRRERIARIGSTWRGDSFGGLRPWSRSVYLWGATAIVKGGLQSLTHPLAERVFDRTVLDCFTMSEELVRSYYQLLQRLKPRRIVGYVSVLRHFALHAERLGYAPLSADKIMPTAEQLDPHSEEIIARFFRGPLLQRYGCREAGDIAHMCEKGSWHLHSDFMYPEVLREDGSIARVGNGHLLLTKLHNELMPLVRYDTEDIVTLSGRSCSCGRALPVMDELQGRLIHHISCPDGRMINALAVSRSVRGHDVYEYQLIQEDEKHLRWLVVPGSNYRQQSGQEMIDYLNRWTNGQFDIRVEVVDEIPQSSGGKRMQVINRTLLQSEKAGAEEGR